MNRPSIQSPFGPLTLTEEAGQLTRLTFIGGKADRTSDLLDEAARQFDAYFAGTAKTFDLPLAPTTGLQDAFRDALLAIPFGETRTYGDLAKRLGQPAQTIGQCCGANPIPIIVPCHRVLAATDLGGYSGGGGIETKVALLKHEGAASLLI